MTPPTRTLDALLFGTLVLSLLCVGAAAGYGVGCLLLGCA